MFVELTMSQRRFLVNSVIQICDGCLRDTSLLRRVLDIPAPHTKMRLV